MVNRLRLVSMAMLACLAAVTAACGADPAGTGSDRTGPSQGSSTEGDAAVWDAPAQGLTASSTNFTAMVTRLGCNGGVTGRVLAPEIRTSATEIVVTFSVAPKQTGEATCLGNDSVPYEVDLREPLGDRALVDGRCLPGGDAATTAFCMDGPTRFKP